MLRAKKAQVYEHFFVDNTRLWRGFLYSIERKKLCFEERKNTAKFTLQKA